MAKHRGSSPSQLQLLAAAVLLAAAAVIPATLAQDAAAAPAGESSEVAVFDHLATKQAECTQSDWIGLDHSLLVTGP